MSIMTIERKVLEKNDEIARSNRELFSRFRVLAFNMVSSPGAGKTSILERTLEHLRGSLRVGIIEGDVQTDLDARRVARYGVPAVQMGGTFIAAKQTGIDAEIAAAQRAVEVFGGQIDTLVPVNHASRAYYGTNQLSEGQRHRTLSYVEVTNAQHFDAFLPFPDYAARYVPLHVYLIRVLNAMYANLIAGQPLPPSQVVRTVPRGAGATPIAPANVPDISSDPAVGDRITFRRDTLFIPE